MHASDRPARRRPKLFWLVWLHRWTGVAFCLMFAVWFASGLVLAFVPFPSLSPQQRWSAAERIDLSRLMVAPAQALRSLRDATALRLVSIGGRPSYVVGSTTATVAVDGIDGQVRGVLPPEAAGAIAAAFGHAAVRRLDGPLDYDQWSVHQKFDPWRPLYRAALQDDLGTVLYVSARTGEVVQRTRASERAWNWVGSVPHWLYFTQLRRSFTAWDRTVWWLALAALCSASAGTVLGVYRTWQRAHSPKPAWSGFRGWLRWHHGLGLIAAVFVLGWIFSGWLSMDHGRLFSKGIPDPAQVARYAGAPLPTVLAGVDAEAVRCLSGATLIEFTAVGGRPVAVGRGPAGPSVSDGMPGRITGTRLSPDAIRHAAARAWMLDHDPMPPDSAGSALPPGRRNCHRCAAADGGIARAHRAVFRPRQRDAAVGAGRQSPHLCLGISGHPYDQLPAAAVASGHSAHRATRAAAARAGVLADRRGAWRKTIDAQRGREDVATRLRAVRRNRARPADSVHGCASLAVRAAVRGTALGSAHEQASVMP
ncbi:PepSY domain-containing protein [Xanthomonas campestris pv. raphani]|uniref:PepSY domain-containing protein n=1 Tax=Xanthomonas campestris TaxID=339 RepID=UPI003890CFF9